MIDPVEYNFKIYLGQTLKYPFVVWNDEEQTSPYDFTGCTVKSQARVLPESTTGINLNATIVSNTIYLNATPAQLASFVVAANNKSAKYYYDVEVTLADTSIWTVVRGIVEVFPEVTKI